MESSRQALLELTRLIDSRDDEAVLTSGEYADVLDVSQQTANRYLVQMEENGWIRREMKGRGQSVSITEEGLGVLQEYHGLLSRFLLKEPVSIKGIVTSGLGEGAYYVKHYSDAIRRELGFEPYPGTLNLKVKQKPGLGGYDETHIPGFKKEDRSFGYLNIYKARLVKEEETVECYLIQPERTHRRSQLEFISEDNLREKLGLEDGEKVQVEIV